MKTTDLSMNQVSVNELLDFARNESVVVTTSDGTSFIVSMADEFSTEVELLRQNHSFLTLLDAYPLDCCVLPFLTSM